MTDQLIERLRRDGTLRCDGRYVLLLSGGRDSTCLLHAAAVLAGPAGVHALHVNYGLRAGADGDERHCAKLCAELGVELTVERPRRPGPPAGNLQHWARTVRYKAAAERARAEHAEILTAHTADDQVETIVYRLISSPSRRAVTGMRARRGAIVRPLLGVARAETTAYCERHGLRWRDDPSNATDAFVRNRIRHDVLPVLRELHPGAEANLLALARRLREEGEVLDRCVDGELAGGATIELARLRSLAPALGGLVVQRLADRALGAPAAGAAAHLEAICAMLRATGSSEVAIGNGLRAVSEYGVVRVERLLAAPAVPEPVALPVPGEVRFGARVVRSTPCAPEPRPGVLDRAALAGELTVRGWQAGDRLAPLGLTGTKSLQDLFTDRRIPRAERAAIPVVSDGRGIVWVAGLALAQRARITPGTVEAVRLTTCAQ